jgi:RimJ/RimL family protein N-acetyltransferase
VGIVGGEEIDLTAGKLEMKKLLGEPGLQGKGIGKWATFGFLYHTFVIRKLNQVYIHSRDINMRNINLNSRFGFELEGVFPRRHHCRRQTPTHSAHGLVQIALAAIFRLPCNRW